MPRGHTEPGRATMRAAVYYSNSDVRIECRPMPQIGPGEALIQVEASGICGSDVMEWYRRPRAPVVLGHEIAGRVVALKGSTKFKVGDRITAAHHVPCNECHFCKHGHPTMCDLLHKTNFDPGGFAEYFRLSPVHLDCGVFVLPDSVANEEAIFTEPLACVLRGQRMAGVEKGHRILVVGAGIAGLLHVKLARALGAERIFAIDIRDYRIQAARRFGADAAWLSNGEMASRVREANQGQLADVVIVCTGAPAAVAGALTAVAPGGTVLFFAPSTPEVRLTIPFNESFWRTDLVLRTSYGASPADYQAALHLIQTGKVAVRDMVTHRFGLSEAAAGFRLVADAAESIKVLLDHRH